MRLLLVTNFCYLLLPYLTQAGSFTDDLGNEFNFDGGEKVVAYSMIAIALNHLGKYSYSYSYCTMQCKLLIVLYSSFSQAGNEAAGFRCIS